MSELTTEYHLNGSTRCEYYRCKNRQLQGEYKEWHDDGQQSRHCYCKDGACHGEHKQWNDNGELENHCFCENGLDITSDVAEIVVDILNISEEEKLLIKLKWGIECLN